MFPFLPCPQEEPSGSQAKRRPSIETLIAEAGVRSTPAREDHAQSCRGDLLRQLAKAFRCDRVIQEDRHVPHALPRERELTGRAVVQAVPEDDTCAEAKGSVEPMTARVCPVCALRFET
ncbi:hypothetical protein MRX96_048102 [Rhipicephalus microplus]